MSNATLVIKDNEGFCNDIWQYENYFTEEQWKEILEGFADIVLEAKQVLEEMETPDFLDDKLYQLGDVANMLLSLEVKGE